MLKPKFLRCLGVYTVDRRKDWVYIYLLSIPIPEVLLIQASLNAQTDAGVNRQLPGTWISL